MKPEGQGEKHKVVIGVIEGDTHDIGKNLVKIMLETSGFEVVDLGRDIPPAEFVENCLASYIQGVVNLYNFYRRLLAHIYK